MDKLVRDSIIFTRSFDGKKCKICGFVQGFPHRGFDRYYCKHITKRVDDYLKEEKERITHKLLELVR